MNQVNSGAALRTSARLGIVAATVAVLAGCSGHASAPTAAVRTSSGFNAALCSPGRTCAKVRATASPSAPSAPVTTGPGGVFSPQPAVSGAITDPAYVPSVQQPISAQNPGTVVGHPALEMLPTGWNTASWIGAVAGFTGQEKASGSSPDPGLSESWSKMTSQVPQGLTVFAALRPSGSPTMIQCSAGGFSPADGSAQAQALAVLSLCADADFPGSETAQAQAWVTRQAGLLFQDLTAMTAGQHVMCATPIYGAGVYEMSARELAAGDPIVTLTVYGSGTA